MSDTESGSVRRLLRVEHHALGPRVYVLGARIHEWHLGCGVLLLLLGLDLGGVLTGGLAAYAIGFLGGWLIAKDWRDLTGAQRDTGAWRLGFHRPPSELRPARRGDWVPKLAALVVATTAIASFTSAVAPNMAFHGHLFRSLAIVHVAAVFHAAVIPVSSAPLARLEARLRAVVGAGRVQHPEGARRGRGRAGVRRRRPALVGA